MSVDTTIHLDTTVHTALLVDDDQDVRYLVGETLAAGGNFEVVAEAEDARGAEALVQETSPDVVLIDLCLGRRSRNGFWLLERLRAQTDAKLIVVTGSGMPEDHDAAVAAGADGVLIKGELTRTLAERIHEICHT